MAELDVTDPAQVASHQVLEADLGIGGRRLVVASGIARPEWKIDSDEVHRGDWTVHLHIPADRIEQVTTHVGLASIGNDDTGYGFATDTASVTVNPTTGELDLTVGLALMGEPSTLNRFAYQVVAVVVSTVSEISGTIRWPRRLFEPPTLSVSDTAPHFTIQLNDRETRPSGGPFGGVIETLTPILAGEVTLVAMTDTEVRAKYRILNPPKGRELRVTVATDIRAPGAGSVLVGPAAGVEDVFTLTLDDPGRSGVDFELVVQVIA